MREALTKAEELLMDLSPDERLVIGTAYCGQNLGTGEILELVPSEDDLEIGGVKYGDYQRRTPQNRTCRFQQLAGRDSGAHLR